MNSKNLFLLLLVWVYLFQAMSTGSAQTWFQTRASTQIWTGIAQSKDGHKQVAVANDGGIYISKNFGISWRKVSVPNEPWEAVATSADGSKLVAVGINAFYISTDGGETWSPNDQVPFGGFWVSATISADGKKIAAVDFYDALVYSSTNSGVSWFSNSIANLDNYQSFGSSRYIAGSADGTKLAVATLVGTIFVSTNSGITWIATTAPIANWSCIAMSKQGDRIVATAADRGEIYVSKDYGITWELTPAPNQVWYGVACSANGEKIVAVGGGDYYTGQIFTSSNFGKTWRRNKTPETTWYSVASSANGNVLSAVVVGGGIYLGLR